MDSRGPPRITSPPSPTDSGTDTCPTPQQFAATLLAGQGEVSPVSLVQFAAIMRAGNAAAAHRRGDVERHRRQALVSSSSLQEERGRRQVHKAQAATATTVQSPRRGALRRRRGRSSLVSPRDGSADRVDRQIDEDRGQRGRDPVAARLLTGNRGATISMLMGGHPRLEHGRGDTPAWREEEDKVEALSGDTGGQIPAVLVPGQGRLHLPCLP